MEDAKPDRPPERPDASQLPEGRDELNLAEFPIALLADRPPRGIKTVEFKDRIYDRGAGREIDRKLTITGSDRYGLPTALDDEVILGLIQLTKLANGFTDRAVKFKRYELTALLGWPIDGRSYRRIADSLNRWLGVTLHYENAWWDKRLKTWVTRGFHIIDNFELLDGRPSKMPDGPADCSTPSSPGTNSSSAASRRGTSSRSTSIATSGSAARPRSACSGSSTSGSTSTGC
jgi:hypothetical protein